MTFRPPIAAVQWQKDPQWISGKSQDFFQNNLLLTTLASKDAFLQQPRLSYDNQHPAWRPAYQPDRTWTQNLVLTTLKSQDAFLRQPRQVYDNQHPAWRPSYQPDRTWVYSVNLSLLGKDAFLFQPRAWTALPPPPPLQPDRTQIQSLVNTTLAGQDAKLTGQQSTQLAPIGPLLPQRSWTWSYNLNLIGKDARLTGQSSYDRPQVGPVQPDRTWVQNLLESTLGVIPPFPPGVQSYALPVFDSRPQRSWTWNYNLNLIGQDASLVGAQSFALPSRPLPAGLTWTQASINIIPPPFPPGIQYFDRPAVPPFYRTSTNYIVPFDLDTFFGAPGQVPTYVIPLPVAPIQPLRSWTLNLLESTLGVVPQFLFPPSAAWNWTKNAPNLNLTLGTVSKAWAWVTNTISGLPFSLGTVSKSWNWTARPAIILSNSIRTIKWNLLRPVMWGVLRGEEERPNKGPRQDGKSH